MSGYGPRVNGKTPGGSGSSGGASAARYSGFTSMPESSSRLSGVLAMPRSYVAPVEAARSERRGRAAPCGQSTPPACSIDVERDPLARLDVRPDRLLGGGQVAGLEGLDDRTVLARQVLAAPGHAATDHLHHQVHRQLPVHVGEHHVAGEVDLEARGTPRSPCSSPRPTSPLRLLHQGPEEAEARGIDDADGSLGRMQLEREPDVVPVVDDRGRHGRDVVAAARLDREEPLGDEPGQGMVHGAAGDAELGGELVQAQLRARPGVAPEHALPESLVDLLVQVRALERRRHVSDVSMTAPAVCDPRLRCCR